MRLKVGFSGLGLNHSWLSMPIPTSKSVYTYTQISIYNIYIYTYISMYLYLWLCLYLYPYLHVYRRRYLSLYLHLHLHLKPMSTSMCVRSCAVDFVLFSVRASGSRLRRLIRRARILPTPLWSMFEVYDSIAMLMAMLGI